MLSEKDWVAPSMREEIMALSPRRSDVSMDNFTQDVSVDPEQLKSVVEYFPVFIAYLSIINNYMLQLTYCLDNGKY